MHLDLEFNGEVIYWRGPAPFFFVPVAPPEVAEIHSIAKQVTYGWGVIPARVTIGATSFTTSLFPKDGGYLVPLKTVIRKAESLSEGDCVRVRLEI